MQRFISLFREDNTYAVLTALKPSKGGSKRKGASIVSKSFAIPFELQEMEDWATQLNKKGFNLYFHVNDVSDGVVIDGARKAKLSEMNADVRFLHVDIDLDVSMVREHGYEEARTRMLNEYIPKLQAMGALVITSTGNGLSAYWRHTTPVSHAMAVAYNKELVSRVGGDVAATDVARIMRLPGTTNWADSKKIAKGYAEQSESSVLVWGDDVGLPFYLDEDSIVVGGAKTIKLKDVSLMHPEMLKQQNLKLRRSNYDYVTAHGHKMRRRLDGDQSSEDYRLCCWMLWATRGDKQMVNELMGTQPFARKDNKWDSKRGDTTYGLYTIEKCAERIGRDYRSLPSSTRDKLNAEFGLMIGHGTGVLFVHKPTGHMIKTLNDIRLWYGTKPATDNQGRVIYTQKPAKKKDVKEQESSAKKKQGGDVQQGENLGETIDAVQDWSSNIPLDNRYSGRLMRPDLAPNCLIEGKYYNTFRGSLPYDMRVNCERVRDEEAEAIIHEHIRDVWACGDEDVYNYVIKWIARMVQQPHVIAGTAICVTGGAGTGKSIIGDMIAGWFSEHFYKANEFDRVIRQFNAKMYESVFVQMEEVTFGGDVKGAQKLKDIITSEVAMVEKKGSEMYNHNSCLHVMMTSNLANPIHLDADDRRFLVLHTSEKRKTEYYDNLSEAIFGMRDMADSGGGDDDDLGDGSSGAMGDNGGRVRRIGRGSLSFLSTLLDMDISDFDIRNIPVLRTDEAISLRNENIISSMDSPSRFIYHWIIECDGKLWDTRDYSESDREFVLNHIYQAYLEFCVRYKIHKNDWGSKTKICELTRKLLGRVSPKTNRFELPIKHLSRPDQTRAKAFIIEYDDYLKDTLKARLQLVKDSGEIAMM